MKRRSVLGVWMFVSAVLTILLLAYLAASKMVYYGDVITFGPMLVNHPPAHAETAQAVRRLPRWAAVFWLDVAAFWALLLAAAWWWRIEIRSAQRRRRRIESGCCEKCGYDIRATSGRCPECGAPVPAALARPTDSA